MASRGAIDKDHSSEQTNASEKSSNGDGALRINEAESSVPINNKRNHEEGPYEAHDHSHAKKYLHRLTYDQTQILEGFFSVCAHPNETQRKELSETTGLTENQVKFWFQNKRTYVKHLNEKEEHDRLKTENEVLIEKNKRLKLLMRNTLCRRCNDARRLQMQETESLKAENEWLQQQIARVASLLERSELLNCKWPMSSPASSRALLLQSLSEHVFVVPDDAQMLGEIASIAVREFVALANSSGPMWQPVPGGSLEVKVKRPMAAVPGPSSAPAQPRIETTRSNAVVMFDFGDIVEFLMNDESYGACFPGVVSSAETTKVYNWPSDAKTGYDGALVLMNVEMVYPSPLVPARKGTFLRYCKKLENGTMAVVNIPVEGSEGDFIKCSKTASGVLIQHLNLNSCKVTVIENVGLDNTGVHDLFKPCKMSLLFGARRWVMSMARQAARIKDVLHVTNSSICDGMNGRRIILKMADRLLANYASSVASTPAEAWTVQCGVGTEEDIKITYSRSESSTNLAIMCASASFLVPVPMRRAFDLLKNNLLRGKWDVLVNGCSIKEEVRVANGAIAIDDRVSILHITNLRVGNKETSMILQNCSYDASGSFLVYSSLDKKVMMDMIMHPAGDGQLASVPIFPAGFSFVPIPDPAQPNAAIGEAGGTAMTAGFQIATKMARGTGLAPRSVASAIKILSEQIKNVKDTLMNSHPVFYRRMAAPAV